MILVISSVRGTLADFVDAFKMIVTQNRGHLLVKCAFQMIAKSPERTLRG